MAVTIKTLFLRCHTSLVVVAVGGGEREWWWWWWWFCFVGLHASAWNFQYFDMDMSYTRVLHIKVAYRVPHK
jgi:hypothetical protein